MIRTIERFAVAASLVLAIGDGTAFARGFGGGGGFRGGYGGGGGYRASAGGFHEGYGGASGYRASAGGFREGYGGASGGFERSSEAFRGYNPYAGGTSSMSRSSGARYGEGAGGGRYASGYSSGSYEGAHGGSIDYAGAGRAVQGPGGSTAARGAGAVQVTTPGGRTYTDVGRAGAARGPEGNTVAGRSNVSAVSGPGGTAVSGSRGAVASGPYGSAGYHSSFGAAAGYGGYGAAGYRGAYGASGYRPYGYNAYGGYHSNWVHGYWNGNGSAAWGMGVGMAMGAGMGWGLSNWGFGSSLYGMGYSSYANPYYVVGGAAAAAPYDYSQPIDTTSAPAPDDVTSQSVASFDAARDAFRQGAYDQALQQTDAALAKTPGDTALHEFRALCLFAMKRYDEAAASLYAVLSVGPGWDWSTLVSLYPDVETYTAQLRALEAATRSNPQSAADRFVLAYHYITQGHTDAAVGLLKQIVALKPDDRLSAKLLKQFAPAAPAQPSATSAPSSAMAETAPPQGAALTGTWTARPAADTTVSLSVKPDGKFTWNVAKGSKTQQFTGTSSYGAGLLTLAADNGPALVGRVNWADASHMTFRITGDGPDDPGLSFAR